ncbi:MAG: discoidin domain-containing protein [Marinagarivorans sp.]
MLNTLGLIFFTSIASMLLSLTVAAGVIQTNDPQFSNLDPNIELQNALTYCSQGGHTCVIPAAKTYNISTGLFIWGNANLIGGGPGAGILFNPKEGADALLNIGALTPKQYYAAISHNMPSDYTALWWDKTTMPTPDWPNITTPYTRMRQFSGRICGLIFTIDPSFTREEILKRKSTELQDPTKKNLILYGQRLIFFWQVDGAEISNNHFYLNNAMYSMSGSGNDNNNLDSRYKGRIRQNIRIVDNIIESLDYKWSRVNKEPNGNEGVDLNIFKGAYIARNTITGFSDDPIALHSVKDAIVEQNHLSSTDGRIYVSSSRCVALLYNDFYRMPWAPFKVVSTGTITFATEQSDSPPVQIIVHGNSITSPPKSRNLEAIIMGYAGRAVTVSNNTFYNAMAKDADNCSVDCISVDSQGKSVIDPVNVAVKFQPQISKWPLDYSQGSDHIYRADTDTGDCFSNSSLNLQELKLPQNLKFLPIDGDGYGVYEPYTNKDGVVYAQYPIKSVLVENNNFAPGGIYTASSIALGAIGSFNSLLGSPTRIDNCATLETSHLGNHKCNAIAIQSNIVSTVPWETCQAITFGNMPANVPSDTRGEPCAGKPIGERQNALIYEAAHPDSASSWQRIFYEENFKHSFAKSDNTKVDPYTIPGRIEAENFHAASPNTPSGNSSVAYNAARMVNQYVDIADTQDLIGAYDVKANAGEWLKYDIQALEDGVYSLTLRTMARTPGSKLHVTIDGILYDIKEIAVPSIGNSFFNVEGVSDTNNVKNPYNDIRLDALKLTRGEHTVHIYVEGGAININYLKFEIFRNCSVIHPCISASSLEDRLSDGDSAYSAKFALDGRTDTRWSSQYSDPQWVQLDLGTIAPINSVTLMWELASAKDYSLEVSDDGSTWRTVARRAGMSNGARTDDFPALTESARYVRMLGTARTTQWGYSLYEFKINNNSLVSASSLEDNFGENDSNFAAKFARDGNPLTRWSSKPWDPQWIRVDLGAIKPINSVTLIWESASAKDYSLEVSNDGSAWRTVATRTGMSIGARTDEFPALAENARYVRMMGTARTSEWGYSLFEFKINGN